MIFIDENTSREELVAALTSDLDAIQFCIDAGIDPELAETPTEVIRETLRSFIEAGDECASA